MIIASRRESAAINIWALCAWLETEPKSDSAAANGSMKTVVFRMRMPVHQRAGHNAGAVNALRLLFCMRALVRFRMSFCCSSVNIASFVLKEGNQPKARRSYVNIKVLKAFSMLKHNRKSHSERDKDLVQQVSFIGLKTLTRFNAIMGALRPRSLAHREELLER